jgi:hypothetical protein
MGHNIPKSVRRIPKKSRSSSPRVRAATALRLFVLVEPPTLADSKGTRSQAVQIKKSLETEPSALTAAAYLQRWIAFIRFGDFKRSIGCSQLLDMPPGKMSFSGRLLTLIG